MSKCKHDLQLAYVIYSVFFNVIKQRLVEEFPSPSELVPYVANKHHVLPLSPMKKACYDVVSPASGPYSSSES